jgi:putative exporter of polyketide antibiotics
MTRLLAGVVLGAQGLAVFFGALVARGLADAQGSQRSSTILLIGSVLALLCILDAALLRQPWGIPVGWGLQVVTFACAFVVPMMILVGLLFGALWVTVLIEGRNLDSRPAPKDVESFSTQDSSGPKTTASDG